jgi:hypothetical protein
MTSTEVLNMAMRVYRQLGWSFLRLTVVPSIFCLGGLAFVLEYVLPSLFYTHQGSNFNGQIGEVATAIVLALLVGGPLFLLGLSYSSSVVIHLTSAYMLGEAIRPEQAVQSARNKVPALLRVSIRELALSTSGVLVALGLMALGAVVSQHTSTDSPVSGFLFFIGVLGLLGGGGVFLYVVILHALAPAVAVLEGANGKQASKRSTWLLKATWGHPAGTYALAEVVALMCFFGFIEWVGFEALFQLLELPKHLEQAINGASLGGLIEAAFDLVPPFLVVWTVLPIWAVCVTIVYYERRIRLEGYDIEALAQEIDRSGRSSRFDV